jgi:hypothetical protein
MWVEPVPTNARIGRKTSTSAHAVDALPQTAKALRCGDHARRARMRVQARTFWWAEFSVNGGTFVASPQRVPANPMAPVQVTIVEAGSQLVTLP